MFTKICIIMVSRVQDGILLHNSYGLLVGYYTHRHLAMGAPYIQAMFQEDILLAWWLTVRQKQKTLFILPIIRTILRFVLCGARVV